MKKVLFLLLVCLCSCSKVMNVTPEGLVYKDEAKTVSFDFGGYDCIGKSGSGDGELYVFKKKSDSKNKYTTLAFELKKRPLQNSIKEVVVSKPDLFPFIVDGCSSGSIAKECNTVFSSSLCGVDRMSRFVLDEQFVVDVMYTEFPIGSANYPCRTWIDESTYTEKQNNFIKSFNSRADSEVSATVSSK